MIPLGSGRSEHLTGGDGEHGGVGKRLDSRIQYVACSAIHHILCLSLQGTISGPFSLAYPASFPRRFNEINCNAESHGSRDLPSFDSISRSSRAEGSRLALCVLLCVLRAL